MQDCDPKTYLCTSRNALKKAKLSKGRLRSNGEAARQGLEFTDLSDAAWASAGVPNVKQMKKTLTFEYSVSRRNIEGGTGPKSVKQQFGKAEAILKKFKK